MTPVTSDNYTQDRPGGETVGGLVGPTSPGLSLLGRGEDPDGPHRVPSQQAVAMKGRHRCRHRAEVPIVITIAAIAVLSLALNMYLLATRDLTVSPFGGEPTRFHVEHEETDT